jgi:hypothetical protein
MNAQYPKPAMSSTPSQQTNSHLKVHPWCIATVTTAKAIKALTEAQAESPGSGPRGGTYRTDHPWYVAHDLWLDAQKKEEQVPLLFAVQDGNSIGFTHYGFITGIDVLSRQLGGYETACRFIALADMHVIWREIDSVALKPTAEQLDREQREGLHVHRFHLTSQLIRPYALCETPPFLLHPPVVKKIESIHYQT